MRGADERLLAGSTTAPIRSASSRTAATVSFVDRPSPRMMGGGPSSATGPLVPPPQPPPRAVLRSGQQARRVRGNGRAQPICSQCAGIPGFRDALSVLDHPDVVAQATANQASDRLDDDRLSLPAIYRRLRFEGLRVGHHRLGLEKGRQLGLQALQSSRKSPFAGDCPRGPGPCQTGATKGLARRRSGVGATQLLTHSGRPERMDGPI